MNRVLWIGIGLLGVGLILLVANHGSGVTFGMGNDVFARTLYLGIWGAVLGAVILGSGMRFGNIARQLAIWALIILALVAGYQYRYELQDIASRVTAGLVPGSPIFVTDGNGRSAVMLERANDGHFIVNADVNGQSVEFLVDTGASRTVLTSYDAKRIGIDVDALQFSIPVSTANGRTLAARAIADRIVIGAIVRDRLPVYVSRAGELSQNLLGMNYLDTLSGYDVRGERMTMRD